jgi:hypothetical protein
VRSSRAMPRPAAIRVSRRVIAAIARLTAGLGAVQKTWFTNLSGAHDGKAKSLGSDECRAGSLGRPCHRAHAAGSDSEAHGHFRVEAPAFREEVTFSVAAAHTASCPQSPSRRGQTSAALIRSLWRPGSEVLGLTASLAIADDKGVALRAVSAANLQPRCERRGATTAHSASTDPHRAGIGTCRSLCSRSSAAP